MTTNHMWTFAECARMRQIIATDYPFPKYLDFDEVARKLNQEFPSNVPFAEAMCYTMNWAIGTSPFKLGLSACVLTSSCRTWPLAVLAEAWIRRWRGEVPQV